MFKAGQFWQAENTYSTRANGERRVQKVGGGYLIWEIPSEPRWRMEFPKASDVIEAKDGFLKIRVKAHTEHTLTLTRNPDFI